MPLARVEATWIPGSEWGERARALNAEGWLLMDLCGVDALELGFDHRFEIAVCLVHRENRDRRLFHVFAQGDPPTIDSVTPVWPTANFFEREAYDLVGIVFEGHPNLTRIMMPEEWEGHPLRKDYGVGKVDVEFIQQPFIQIDTLGQSTMHEEAKVELDHLGQVKIDNPDDARQQGRTHP